MTEAQRHKGTERRKLLGSLFIEAGKRGISQADLRDTIAPLFLKKRLSAATEIEINKLRSHITGLAPGWKKYTSSLEGLRQEVVDLATQRFGADFEAPLNALCKRFGVQYWKWLNVSHAKAIKQRLIKLQAEGPYHPVPKVGTPLLNQEGRLCKREK